MALVQKCQLPVMVRVTSLGTDWKQPEVAVWGVPPVADYCFSAGIGGCHMSTP